MQPHPTNVVVHAALIEGGAAHAADVHASAHDASPALRICGMRQRHADETARRVTEALVSSHLPVPARDVTINVNPGPLETEHPELDLPIALAVLVACGHLIQAAVAGVAAVGELRPSGAVSNTFPLGPAIDVITARTALVPVGHLKLPSQPGTEIVRVESLRQAVEALCEKTHTAVTGANPLALTEEPPTGNDLTGLLAVLDATTISDDEAGGEPSAPHRRLWRPRLVPGALRRTGD